MIWVNIPTAFLRSPEYVGAEPVERATWLSLMGYCCEQENGGRVRDCKGWKDRRWQQTAGVTAEEVAMESELWEWDGSDLVLLAYPAAKEREIQAKRRGGKAGGKASGEARREASGEASGEAQLEPELQGVLERKGKEGNRKVKECTAPTRAEPASGQKEIGWGRDGFSGITEDDLNDWAKAYPACDISRQLAAAHQWLKSNPSKAHKKNWRRFATNWLSRAQERGGDAKSNPTKAGTCL